MKVGSRRRPAADRNHCCTYRLQLLQKLLGVGKWWKKACSSDAAMPPARKKQIVYVAAATSLRTMLRMNTVTWPCTSPPQTLPILIAGDRFGIEGMHHLTNVGDTPPFLPH